jgi:uncharacterized protein YifE (UPF0438 family)
MTRQECEEFKQVFMRVLTEQKEEQNRNIHELQELCRKQQQRMEELEKGLKEKMVDYECMFEEEMEKSTLSVENKEKLSIYYYTLISEMERYYLLAKVLSKSEVKISFEEYADTEEMKALFEGKKSSSYVPRRLIEAIFKFFEKNESKIEMVGELMKEIPYMALVMKIVKNGCKSMRWVSQIGKDSSC